MLMKLPSDWDVPSQGNKELCDKFIYETFDYSAFPNTENAEANDDSTDTLDNVSF